MKYLHTMIRVGNLERSIDFYTNILGLKLHSKKDYETGRFSLAFLGIDEPEGREGSFLELTYNWDTDHYNLGDGYGHMAFLVDDIYSICEQIKDRGGSVTRAPGPMKHGSTILAFVEDPDGYKIELINA